MFVHSKKKMICNIATEGRIKQKAPCKTGGPLPSIGLGLINDNEMRVKINAFFVNRIPIFVSQQYRFYIKQIHRTLPHHLYVFI
jgi:hypothetical protein